MRILIAPLQDFGSNRFCDSWAWIPSGVGKTAAETDQYAKTFRNDE
jgi:hypothetical protein